MKNKNVIQEKSFAFALRIIKAYQFLTVDKKEFILSRQLLRAGTSIGANIEEALGGLSEKDFIFKLTIAYKEARESGYWIRLLNEAKYLTPQQFDSLMRDVVEIQKIIGSIQRTLKSKNE